MLVSDVCSLAMSYVCVNSVNEEDGTLLISTAIFRWSEAIVSEM